MLNYGAEVLTVVAGSRWHSIFLPTDETVSSSSFSANREEGRRWEVLTSPDPSWWLQKWLRRTSSVPVGHAAREASDLGGRTHHCSRVSQLPRGLGTKLWRRLSQHRQFLPQLAYKPSTLLWTRDPWLHPAACFLSGSASLLLLFLTTLLAWCQSLSKVISLVSISRIINNSF